MCTYNTIILPNKSFSTKINFVDGILLLFNVIYYWEFFIFVSVCVSLGLKMHRMRILAPGTQISLRNAKIAQSFDSSSYPKMSKFAEKFADKQWIQHDAIMIHPFVAVSHWGPGKGILPTWYDYVDYEKYNLQPFDKHQSYTKDYEQYRKVLQTTIRQECQRFEFIDPEIVKQLQAQDNCNNYDVEEIITKLVYKIELKIENKDKTPLAKKQLAQLEKYKKWFNEQLKELENKKKLQRYQRETIDLEEINASRSVATPDDLKKVMKRCFEEYENTEYELATDNCKHFAERCFRDVSISSNSTLNVDVNQDFINVLNYNAAMVIRSFDLVAAQKNKVKTIDRDKWFDKTYWPLFNKYCSPWLKNNIEIPTDGPDCMKIKTYHQ